MLLRVAASLPRSRFSGVARPGCRVWLLVGVGGRGAEIALRWLLVRGGGGLAGGAGVAGRSIGPRGTMDGERKTSMSEGAAEPAR